MVRLGLIIYENILKCDKCATEYIEIQKSFSLWCIIVNFLRQTKAKGLLLETKFHFHSAQTNFVYMLMPPVTRPSTDLTLRSKWYNIDHMTSLLT